MPGQQFKTEEKTEYRSIFKATSLFGGVKIFEIIIQILRSKIVALLIGPTGVGIMGMYLTSISLIQSATQFGLGTSAVRDISQAYSSNNQDQINKTVTVMRRLVWFTGLLGMLVMILFSPILSKSSFGNYKYILSFCCLSVVLLCHQISAGQGVLLRGTRKLKYMAKSTLLGQLIGFVVCIPLFYIWGIDAILPVLIIGALTGVTLTWYFARKVNYTSVKVTLKQLWTEGNSMIKMGLAMSLSGVLVYLTSYILRSYISNDGGMEVVGLFQAGSAIVTSYVGLVFSAMGTDYYPRLSSINQDNHKCRILINQQAEIGILILAPLLMCCIIFIPIVIRILYSDKFLEAAGYIIWACAGMLFKMASWAISFIFIAKSESKIFIINETLVNIYSFIFQLVGYCLWGLSGIGIGYSLCFLCYFFQMYLVSHKRFHFSFTDTFKYIFSSQTILLGACLVSYLLIPVAWIKYVVGAAIIIISASISLNGLDKRMGVLNAIKARVRK